MEAWKLPENRWEPEVSVLKGITPSWLTKRPWLLEPISMLAFASGGGIGRSKDLIPGKCFLLFQDHGLAHVRPQTLCTIAGAAREEKAEGNKIRKRKKAFGIQMQTTASITEAGTRGNTRNDVGYWDNMGLAKETCRPLLAVVSTLSHCKSLQRGKMFIQWGLACVTAEQNDAMVVMGMQPCKLHFTAPLPY